jgi:Ca-activated chloride channel family protein
MDTSVVRGGARARSKVVAGVACLLLTWSGCAKAPPVDDARHEGNAVAAATPAVALSDSPEALSVPEPSQAAPPFAPPPAPAMPAPVASRASASSRHSRGAAPSVKRAGGYRGIDAVGGPRSLDDLLNASIPSPASGSSSSSSSASGRGYGRGGGGVGLGTIGVSSGRGALALAPVREEDFDTEAYAHIAEQGFVQVADSPLSTFSIDVDTASYSNVRRMLREGRLPPADAVRIEEMINYFRYDYPEPRGDAPVAIHTELAAAPWAPTHRLVQIGLRARELKRDTNAPRNLVFLVDVSGSMESDDKLPLLKSGLAMLARDLKAEDRLSIVVYAGASGLALPPTRGDQREAILAALGQLEAGGSTNGAEGIELAYRVARNQFIRGGINRVILATDGDFNVGVTSQGELVRLIEEQRKSGVFLTVLGFGAGNLKDSTMESLADKGNGNYAYIDSLAEAHKVLVREAGATLVTVAKDVKLQVEWNPSRVASYRLVGYENRKLADRDFNDDTKDAGEMGAGHTVTALYDVVLRGDASGRPEIDPLRYQAPRVPSAPAESAELLTVKLRYKTPDSGISQLVSQPLLETAAVAPSHELSFAAAVAGFGMLLRGSENKGALTLRQARALAVSAVEARPSPERRELVELMDEARRLGML